MNKFLWLTLFRLLDAADGLSGGGGAAVADAPPAAAADPAPVSSAPAVDPTAPAVADPAAPAADPNDPFAALEAAMKAELGDEAPPADPAAPPVAGNPQAAPPEFQQLLDISEFVKSPEGIQAAVRAADEVWKVTSGQAPASGLLEAMRAANPEGYQALIDNLIPYIESVTGKAFGAAPETPPDPRDARLSALEQNIQREQQQRQTAIFNAEIGRAREAGMNFLTDKAKGTFLEGSEQYVWQQIGAKADVTPEQMTKMLLSGKTEKLEAAFKAVQREEGVRLKAYNDRIIKKHRTLANGVPASKGGAPDGNRNASGDFDAYLPGESAVQYATRQFNKGRT